MVVENTPMCWKHTNLPLSSLRTCHPFPTHHNHTITQPQSGKRHQQNLAKRAALEAKERAAGPAPMRTVPIKKTVKIGRPGYRVTKQYAGETQQRSLLFQVGILCHVVHDPPKHTHTLSLLHTHTHILKHPHTLSNTHTLKHTHSLSQIDYPEIEEGERPRHRFMSAFEQRKEAWDKAWQYLLFAAEPYEVIAFKIPNYDVEKADDAIVSHW